jgi:hypothetical protein
MTITIKYKMGTDEWVTVDNVLYMSLDEQALSYTTFFGHGSCTMEFYLSNKEIKVEIVKTKPR